MKHVHYPDVEAFDSLSLGLEGSANMIVKLLSDDAVCIEIAPGGHTPDHTHGDKERVVVISGSGEIKAGEERRNLGPGDFVECASDEQHQIVNNGTRPLVFMCFRNQR